ncbi:MAG: metal-dependent transcriptional regulator [Kiritimatiellia bacterium]
MRSLSLSQQQYLETIADLIREKGRARLHEVADRLAVRPPSAWEVVSRLGRQGLVRRKDRFQVALTVKGILVVQQLDRRHEALRIFISNVLAMDCSDAEALACRIEHFVSAEFAERLVRFIEILTEKYPLTLKTIVRYMSRPHSERTGERNNEGRLEAAGGKSQ